MTAPSARPHEATPVETIDRHRSTDTDLSDVARSLTDYTAHRPSTGAQDLQRANQELHSRGLLPGLDLVGVNGQDFVVRGAHGKEQYIDSANTDHRRDVTGYNQQSLNGRHADISQDGSGTVTARPGDNRGWNLAHDILRSRGNENPTPNEMANFQRALEKENGKPTSQFKPGEHIKVPPTTAGGDSTHFNSERMDDRARAVTADVDRQAKEGEDALHKFATGGEWMNQDRITAALNRQDLTPEDKRGLQFLQDHYHELATPSSFWSRSGVWASNVESWKKQQENRIEADRARAFG